MIDKEEMFHKLTDWFIWILWYIPHKDLKHIDKLAIYIKKLKCTSTYQDNSVKIAPIWKSFDFQNRI
jgi:hypothetical protein